MGDPKRPHSDNDPAVAGALDALEEGVQILAPDWRYLYVNEAVARQGRKAREELLGRTMHACYPGIERTPMFSTLERCMRERCPAAIENEFAYENGQTAWFELRVRPCPAGLIVLSLDMTERKSVERRLEESYRQALRDLVTPVLRVHPSVLLVPLIGAVDAKRAARVTETVLSRVAEQQARVVIFDVAGVPELDLAIAGHLVEATAMVRLLGAGTILTGLGPSGAKSLALSGLDHSTMRTTGQLADGIQLALAEVADHAHGDPSDD